MAKVNLVRRAEIGQEKRARTRAQLVAAACDLEATLVGGSFVDGEPETPRRRGADGAYRRIDWEPTRLLWVLNLRKRSRRERRG